MKCPTCGKDKVRPAKLELRRTVAGRAYVATVHGEKCAACGEELIAAPDLERFGLALAGEVGLHVEPSGSVFRTMRKILGFTSQEAASLLGVSLETISRWENGARSVDPLAFRLLGMIAGDRLEGRTSTEDSLRAAREPAPPGELRIALARYDVRKSLQAVTPVMVSDVVKPYGRSVAGGHDAHEEKPVVKRWRP
jgi:putative zinc finger/helix-turn-helix YgiT family protein